MQIYTIEALLLLFLILITICIIYERDLLSAVMTYSAFSFCAVLLYLMMGSPDVAFTEVVVDIFLFCDENGVHDLLRHRPEKNRQVV